MTNIIKFQNNELEVININGMPYLRGRQIGDTLQLAKGYRAVQKIFQRHRNEFTPDMMLSIELPTNGGKQLTNVFSARGAALIAMYAQTPVAAQFRAFILDVLEGKQSTKAQAEQLNTLREELLRLCPEWAKILRCHQAGLSGREIGKVVGKSRTTVNMALQRMHACGFPVRLVSGRKPAQLSLPFGG